MCRSASSTQQASPAAEKPTDGAYHRALTEAAEIFRLGWPQTVSSVTSFSPRLFLLAAVGHLPNGALLVGAAGIGSMYANFSQLMLIRSSTFGATPLFSQAFGAGNHHRVGMVLMRVLAIHVVMALCLSLPLTMIAGPLLAAVGQPAALAAHAQTFVAVRLLGLPGVVVIADVSTFLNAQRCVRLPMMINIAGSLVQVVLCFGLTRALGFVGAPLAMTAVELLQGMMLLMAAPVILKRNRLRSWPRWCSEARQALRGWGEIGSRGGPAAVMVTSEWFGWEVSLFIASGLCGGQEPCAAIEAIPLCTTVFVCQFIVIFGVPLATSIRVGNLLGEGRGADARYCAKVAWVMTFVGAVSLATLILCFRERIGSLFVDDEEIIWHLTRLMPITTVYSVLASLAPGWSQQVLFGLGARLRIPAAINFVSFFVVGLPVGSLLAYQTDLGAPGLWLGLVLAMVLIIAGQYTYIATTIDWADAARVARERALGKDKGGANCQHAETDVQGLAAADSAKATFEL